MNNFQVIAQGVDVMPLVSLSENGEVVFNIHPDPRVVRAQITALKDRLLALSAEDQTEMPVTHELLDGMYMRKLFIPKDTIIVGKIHLKGCFNFVEKGDISVMTETGSKRVQAGYTLTTPPGIQKVGYAHEDTIFINVFRTDQTDIEKIEAEIATEDYAALAALDMNKQEALCQ